jgi:flagellar basal-body rod modification protein FlgD
MNDGEISLTAYELSNYYDVYSFGEVSDTSEVVDSTNEDSSITIKDSNGKSYSYSTYNKTYEDLATEISKTSAITASMAQNTDGNYQLVVSVSGGSSSVSQNDSKLAYSQSSATSYSSTPSTIAYTDITKIY